MTKYTLHAKTPDPDTAEDIWEAVYGEAIPEKEAFQPWLSFPLGGEDFESMLANLWGLWGRLLEQTTYGDAVGPAVETPVLVTCNDRAVYSERINP